MYNGINGKGRVVLANQTAEQVEAIKLNPAYNFVRWVPVVEKVAAPIEVDDVVENASQKDGDSNTKGRSGRKTNR